jgi:hypothetical protein
MSYRYALAQHGLTLATRPFAKDLRVELVRQASDHELLELDFTDILSTSYSFADELVACLAEEAQAGKVDFDVAMSGASSEVEDVVGRALQRRKVNLFQLS